MIALALLFAAALYKHFNALQQRIAVAQHASALVIIGVFILSNYVAYVVPNHRSGEFLVFCVLALSLRPARAVAAPHPSILHWRPSP